MNYWPLLGVAVIVVGFALRFNAVPVVVVAALVSGLLAGLSVADLLALLGNSFVSQRMLLLFVLTLPAIGLLERAGLREHAQRWMARLQNLTLARLLAIALWALPMAVAAFIIQSVRIWLYQRRLQRRAAADRAQGA